MAVFKKTQIGMKQIGGSVTVPEHSAAKLMYYLESMASVLDLNDPSIKKLSNYRSYSSLNDQDINVLYQLCTLLNPNILINECIFRNENMPGYNNRFYELEAVTNVVSVANTVVIGGRHRKVTKIMFFKMEWLNKFYYQPMAAVRRALLIKQEQDRQRQRIANLIMLNRMRYWNSQF